MLTVRPTLTVFPAHFSGSEHGAIKSVIDRFRSDAGSILSALRRCLTSTSSKLSWKVVGGQNGRLSAQIHDSFFDGALHFSKLLSPPIVKPYMLLSSFQPNGQLQVSSTHLMQPCAALWLRLQLCSQMAIWVRLQRGASVGVL